jgi:hypothetical protein
VPVVVLEVGVDRVEVEFVRVVVIAHPVEQVGVLFVAGISPRLEQAIRARPGVAKSLA